MMVSYQWLQTFFDGKLPSPEKVAEALTFGAFEIEGIEKKGDDTVIDVKVLPDRACYALSHRGVAKEISTLLSIPMTRDPLSAPSPHTLFTDHLKIEIDEKRCPYYSVALIEEVEIGPSPEWLKARLESVGQRSINNVVDATNYVMYELGTPLHAFDMARMSGAISVRAAREGETITVLGGETKTLTEAMSVVADTVSGTALAVAGVKGGVTAEVTTNTKSIVLEAATFHPTITRKTAQMLNVRTDASKRFENGVSAALPLRGLVACATLITEIAGGTLKGVAEAGEVRASEYVLGIAAQEVNRLLGTSLTDDDVEMILKRFGFAYEKIPNPRERLVALAKEQVGKPYKLGASVSKDAPRMFDCSSLTAWLHMHMGVSIPRISIDQFAYGDPIERKDLQPGDLVFGNNNVGHIWFETQDFVRGMTVPEGIDHVGVYIGDDEVLHAAGKGHEKVVIEKLDDCDRFNKEHMRGFRRMFRDAPRFVITVPPERLDLRIPQDLIEEIGRVFGYEHIAPQELPPGPGVLFNPRYRAMEIVRKTLEELGYMEIMTYALSSQGEVTLANPLAPERAHLRNSLEGAMREALHKNHANAPLLGGEPLKLFEVGTVFTHDNEFLHLSLGVHMTGKKSEARIEALLREAEAALALSFGIDEKTLGAVIKDGILTCDMTPFIGQSEALYPKVVVARDVRYRPLSAFPFVLRDIALWVTNASTNEVAEVIREVAGELLVALDQFDTFTKDGKTSFAYHLVFQAFDRTLSDSEVSEHMVRVEAALRAKGWEIR